MASKDDIKSHILHVLDKFGSIPDTKNLPPVPGHEEAPMDQLVILGALNSLADKEMVQYTTLEKELWVLSKEGQDIANTGSHEAKVFYAVPAGTEGLEMAELTAKLGPAAKIGQGKAFKNKWIKKDGSKLLRLVESIEDQAQDDLQEIVRTGNHSKADVLKDLKRRKLCDRQRLTSYSVSKGPNFSLTERHQETDITAEMLQNKSWKESSFKKYNFAASAPPPPSGHLHPLMKVREEFRQIFLEMGFSEMPANRFVENSFWNFDALFVPQAHSARDLQDTFYISDPAVSGPIPEAVLGRVAKVHSEGGYGSVGYGTEWKRSEADKLVLRTHTTAVSAHMLYLLAQQPEFQPAKYFSIDRVFRNESVDATHLAEFHQVEGVIADRNATLGNLIGFMDAFFAKMGVHNIRFKPTYNPYTEPSMEIFSYHAGLKEWVEIGNSGMFRPELTRPLGLPEDVRVLGWGLSLERPTMIKYGIDNIRELLGHKVDLGMIQRNPLCRLDKKMGKERYMEDEPVDPSSVKVVN
ncbi:tRNA synthetases class II core domain (F)-domain-containing protein [Piptocephalis cylindrospora]|uniref:Phenylalanine--tRNA ligase alpha subunit n=1 Tax=Piptocephalis cylindrospora TaxID=1907219 RepID=A0A4P9Y0M2_9FUNG|nr:tRNA synthetases class II core domain (F)-domain-containing protein [Piptocephalis cylindrospora]|eukprot:RKP12214.1 tRNA synthetases class II core domain (F)-domain-containing protein [Piptocephalis cylindrospora]